MIFWIGNNFRHYPITNNGTHIALFQTKSKKNGGDIMNTETENKNKIMTTNLYSIIEAIEGELHTEETELVPSIVMHMIDSGKIKLTCETNSCRSLLN